ncbi:MAG: MFS transporter [Actinomycetota bacterium]
MTGNDEPETGAAGTSGGEVLGGSLGEASHLEADEPVVQHTRTYLRSLLLLLLAATFFEGYDGAILALVLGSIRDTFNVPEAQLGISRAIIELGLGGAFFLARAGDRWGRRTLLLWSVLGYTVMTALTAISWDLWSFTAFQSLSRVFLGAEYAVALTMIVEEFPKERRARAIGQLLMCSAIGAVVVALLLVAGVEEGPLAWRTLYLIGVIPLLFLAFFRRRLKETRRFQEHRSAMAEGGRSLKVNFFEPWRPAFRRTLVLVGLIHLMRSLPLFGATSWFFYFAEREAGIGSTSLYVIFIVAYGFGTLGYLVCGTMMDRIGRRPTAIGFGVIAAVSSSALFQARGTLMLGVLLVVAVFFGLGMAPVMGAISTELFPTYIRNQSAAWARNIFEIAGFILGPLLVGVLGDHYTGALGSIGDTVSLLTLLFVPMTWLIWRHLPETKGRELEEIERDLGIDVDAGDAPPSRGRAWAIFAGIIVFSLAAGVFGVRALGNVSRRPEGAAERFLQAVADGEAGDIERYGAARVARSLFGGRNIGFERVEIGGATRVGSLDYVPFRVTLEDPEKIDACADRDPCQVAGTLLVAEADPGGSKELEVAGISPGASRADRELADGGVAGASASPVAWPVAFGVVVLLTLLAEVALRRHKVNA